MKKIIYSLSFLFISAFAFGQNSISIDPNSSTKVEINHNSFASDDNPHLKLRQTVNGSYGRIRMENANGSLHFTQKFGFNSNLASANLVQLDYAGNQLYTVYGDGNFRIGTGSGVTPNPSSLLFVDRNGDNYLGLASPNANESGILFGKPTLGAASGGIVYDAANNMNFRTGGNINRMIITNTGYIKLGDDVASTPKIKMKKLTGTNGAVSATKAFPHGLTQSKILSVSILINDSVNNLDNPPFLSDSAYKYEFYVDASNIQIVNVANSSAIAGRPVKILITYEE